MSVIDPNLGLTHSWALRESGWNVGMDANLIKLGAIVQLSVLDVLTVPPVSPANGDRYIVGASATGDWAGQDNAIAVYLVDSWEFYYPSDGWIATIATPAGASVLIFDAGTLSWLPPVLPAGIVTVDNDETLFSSENMQSTVEEISAAFEALTAKLTKVTPTVTLLSTGWTANEQTITVTGATATSINTIILEDQTNGDLWGAANIYGTGQAVNNITFTCETEPTSDISFKVAIKEPV